MTFFASRRRSLSTAIALGITLGLAACGSKEPSPQAQSPAPAPATAPEAPPPAAASPAPIPTATDATVTASWTPEALEDLLAPVALYPDPVLSQVLIASTNPQEVLDAGNWLLENQSLKGKALDDAAAAVGFTPPIRALVQFPDTLDMMCRELGWTAELGQAFVADQAGVLDAVQRLRRQAKDVGNLQTTPQMVVDTQQQAGKEVIVLEPPPSQVVSVPQYDPVAVYAPPPATAPAATAAPATTTTTTTETKTGHSTGTLVTTGLLAFGAGILVNELFDDDDHHHNNDYWYPNYGYGGMPYYPPYPYRPAYGNGFYPGSGYRPPPGYGGGFYNSGNIIVTNPGGRNDYWDRYDNNRPNYQRATTYKSPISAAKPNRPELADLNKRQPKPMPANVQRPNPDRAPANWKGRQAYAGADGTYKGAAKTGKDKVAQRPEAPRPAPKVQGTYKGAPTDKAMPRPPQRDAKPAARPEARPAAKPVAKPAARPSGQGDRGYAKPASRPDAKPMPAQKPQSFEQPRPQSKPQARPQPRPQPKPSAVSGADRSGKADRAASQRGKQSLPQGARSKGGGGGKGGGKQTRR